MPNTILKRWNGTSFEELYPKTTVGQISASGTANNTTFLRGDGQWIAPAFSDLSGSATIAQLPTITVAKGGTNATSLTAGGALYMNQSGGTVLATAAGSQNQILRATAYNGVFYAPAWESPVDSSANAALSTASTSIPTERDIAFGLVRVNNADQTRATTVYAPTAGGTAGQRLQAQGATSIPSWIDGTTSITATAAVNSATAATVTVTGYRMILVQVWRNTTDQIYSFWVDLTDTTYNFNTTARNLRFRWWDGTTGWDNTITVQNSSGLRLQHNAGGTMIFKCTGVR
jgi:hypothetical protein